MRHVFIASRAGSHTKKCKRCGVRRNGTLYRAPDAKRWTSSAPPCMTANAKHRIELEEARVAAAIAKLKYGSFEEFYAANSDLDLVQMADKLEVPRAVFLSYHARYVRANAKPAPDVESAR